METPSEMVAGGCAGLAEHLVMFPFDTIKTRMQQDPLRNTSMIVTAKHIIRSESPANFYRGWGPVATSAFPAHAAYFALYEFSKRWLDLESTLGYAASAACATCAHDTVSVPFDVVKQRMQVDGIRHFHSSLECLKSICRGPGGVSSLFASLPTTIAMNIPQVTMHWVVYENVKLALQADHISEDSIITYIVAGGSGGCAAATVSTPLDNVKTLLQLGEADNARLAARKIVERSGWGGFFTGVGPRMFYMAPSAAVVMTTYELVKWFLRSGP